MTPDLQTLLDNLPCMAYRRLLDEHHTLLYASGGCLDLTGHPAQALLNNHTTSYMKLIVPEDRPAVRQELEAALRKKQPYRFFYRIKTAAGEQRWVIDRGAVVPAAVGTVEVLEGFITDNTEGMAVLDSLERRIADRTRKLTALYDILEAGSEPADLQTTINRALQRALRAIKGKAGAIHLLDDTGKVLQMVAQKDLPEAAAKRLAQIEIEGNMRAGWIVRNNEPLFIPRMSADARAVDLAQSSELEIYSAVPIVARDQVLGVLTVLSDAISPYPAHEEMELLTSVGEQLGIVVENARLRLRAEQLLVLQERNRLARELHDSVTQSLYSVTLFAEAGLNLTQSAADERVAQLFSDVIETGQQALKEMRLLLHNLRPSLLTEEGLIRALEHRLNAVEGRAGINHQLIVEGALNLAPDVEEALYQVALEALNNALSYARADSVQVHLSQDSADNIILIVADDGQGFDLKSAAAESGLGLITMRERVEQLGGEIAYSSAIGQGTEVRASVPAHRAGGV